MRFTLYEAFLLCFASSANYSPSHVDEILTSNQEFQLEKVSMANSNAPCSLTYRELRYREMYCSRQICFNFVRISLK